ncbi:MAG: surface lipoprotein assembly modifier [Chromatiales bacterium]|nr:surface lipoprotein assembly modifier [Chromatiales bacterium]
MHTTSSVRIYLLLILSIFSSQLFAQPVIEQLKSLSAKKQYSTAYQLAQKHRGDLEGESEFDFLYGVAAIDTGHVNEGVFALERVVFSNQKNHLARLELARGYFLQGDDIRSRQEFEKVLKVNPPTSVIDVVNKFMAAIRIRESQYKTSASAYVDIEAGYDSNVNAGPERNTLGIFENLLSVDKFQKKDSYMAYAAGGKLNHPVTPHSSLFLSADASMRRNSKERVNNNELLTIQTGMQWQKERAKYRLSLIGQLYRLDGSINRNMYGVGFENSVSTSKSHQRTFSLNLVDMAYPSNATYDSSQLTLGLSSITKAKKSSWHVGVNVGLQSSKIKTEAAKSGADRLILGGNIGSLISISNKSNVDINLSWSLSEYSGVYIGSTAKRADTYSKLALTYNHLMSDKWKYRMSISHSQNDSNVALLTYKQSQLLVGFQRVF